jgi:hypothetical protein
MIRVELKYLPHRTPDLCECDRHQWARACPKYRFVSESGHTEMLPAFVQWRGNLASDDMLRAFDLALGRVARRARQHIGRLQDATDEIGSE